jgi:hypothetical protein
MLGLAMGLAIMGAATLGATAHADSFSLSIHGGSGYDQNGCPGSRSGVMFRGGDHRGSGYNQNGYPGSRSGVFRGGDQYGANRWHRDAQQFGGRWQSNDRRGGYGDRWDRRDGQQHDFRDRGWSRRDRDFRNQG